MVALHACIEGHATLPSRRTRSRVGGEIDLGSRTRSSSMSAGRAACARHARRRSRFRYLTNSIDVGGRLPAAPPRGGGQHLYRHSSSRQQMFRRFGAEVTVVEKGPRLIHREDPDISAGSSRRFSRAKASHFRLRRRVHQLLARAATASPWVSAALRRPQRARLACAARRRPPASTGVPGSRQGGRR